MNFPITSLILLGVGFLVAFVGGIMVLVAAFRQSVGWGLIALFVPCGNLVFTCVHWAVAKKGTLISLLGLALLVGGIFALPGQMRAGMGQGSPLALLAPGQPPQKDLAAQIAEKRAQVETQDAAFALDGAELTRQFAELEARRNALPPGGAAALAKFNADAAIYQGRTTRRKQMFADLQTAQRELDALLARRAQGGAAKTVVMYSTAQCPACVMAKQYFAKKGVQYQEINVETSADGRAAFQKLGGRGVPLILVGEKRVEGFNAQALDAML